MTIKTTCKENESYSESKETIVGKRLISIVLALVVVVGVGGIWYYQQQTNVAHAAAANLQTATVTRGTLVATVAGAGNINAPQETNLSFQLTGVPITTVSVKVGDKVKAGDVLAEEDNSDLQFALRSAQAQLSSAQANLSKLQQPPLAADVAADQAAVASAQSAYNVAVNKNNHAPDQLLQAKAALDKADAALQQAQAAYNAVAWRPSSQTQTQAAALASATSDYEAAKATYNLALTDINDSAVKSAAQALSTAQDNLTKLTQPATPQDIAVAQASVDSAQVAVDQANRNLDQAKIIAPFAGTVGAVNYVQGQLSPANTQSAVITLVNMDNLQTQITVSEVDITKVKVGQVVDMSFDALGGQSFPGKILSIGPVGTVTSGVVNYVVTVALTKPNAAVMPGMTATASITVDQRQDVLMVPNRAVKTQGNQHVVTLLFEGNQIPAIVKTGLTNDTNTEILSASSANGQAVQLQEGDTLVLNPTTTTTSGGLRGGGGNPLGALTGFGGR
jgi:HlyD family secretion protein